MSGDAMVMLEGARRKEKEAHRLRTAGSAEGAITAYEEARELYAESGLQYSRDGALSDAVMGAIKRCDAIARNIRRPKEKRPPAITPRPDCLSCGKPLRRYKIDGRTFDDGTPQEWGDYGDQRFCGLTCGWRWACEHAPMPKKGSR